MENKEKKVLFKGTRNVGLRPRGRPRKKQITYRTTCYLKENAVYKLNEMRATEIMRNGRATRSELIELAIETLHKEMFPGLYEEK